MTQTPPIGLLGGTFDPIHNGHLAIAQHVLEACQLSRIDFIPSFQPPHRDAPMASPEQRLAMVSLAIKNHPHFSLCDYEVQQRNTSYTIDTLTHLRNKHPKQPFCFIIGDDAFAHFHEWEGWQTIANIMHLIVVKRSTPIITTPQINTLLRERETNNPADLRTTLSGKIYCLDIKPIATSATQVRQDIKAGKHPAAELDKAVWAYVVKHQIYGYTSRN